MIYITQLIYLKEGKEDLFFEFENIAISCVSKHNGQLLLRIRPDNSSIVEGTIDKPFEIHLVSFNSKNDFENFKSDEERKKFLHLKEESISSTITIEGKLL